MAALLLRAAPVATFAPSVADLVVVVVLAVVPLLAADVAAGVPRFPPGNTVAAADRQEHQAS
jgi:hypothetical protein